MTTTINALRRGAGKLGQIGLKISLTGLTLGATLATQAVLAADKVKDLPGGPAVNQLDLHPPVTEIAADQRWLHYFLLVICSVIFIGVFGVMFYSILSLIHI